jgi:hypothetical protein
MGQEATSAGNPDWDINLLLVGNPQGFEAAFGPHPEVTTAPSKQTSSGTSMPTQHPDPLTLSQLTHYWPIGDPPAPTSTPSRDPIIYRPKQQSARDTPRHTEQTGPSNHPTQDGQAALPPPHTTTTT